MLGKRRRGRSRRTAEEASRVSGVGLDALVCWRWHSALEGLRRLGLRRGRRRLVASAIGDEGARGIRSDDKFATTFFVVAYIGILVVDRSCPHKNKTMWMLSNVRILHP